MRKLIAGNYETALKEWRPLAEQGDADAQYVLGYVYDNANGKGVTQDYAKKPSNGTGKPPIRETPLRKTALE